jgi:ethanolamine utilization protein EutP (predicted NTPase)
VEYEADIGVDTPGEFSATPVSIMPDHHGIRCRDSGLCAGADDFSCRMPPGLLDVYGQKQVIGVITKTDLPQADAIALSRSCEKTALVAQSFGLHPACRTGTSLKHILTGATGSWGPGFVPGEEALP